MKATFEKLLEIDLKIIAAVIVFLMIGGYFIFKSNAAPTNFEPVDDIKSSNIIGVGKSTYDYYKNVADGTSLSNADENKSYVASADGVSTAYETLGYYPFPNATNLIQITDYFRAYKGTAKDGSIQVVLYNGNTLIGYGEVHKLGSTYQNYSDTFNNLNIVAGQLRTKVIIKNNSDEGAPRYTMIYLGAEFGNGNESGSTLSGSTTRSTPVNQFADSNATEEPSTQTTPSASSPSPDVIPPNTPTNVTANLNSSSSNTVQVEWSPAIDNAGGSGMREYIVSRTDQHGNVVNYVVNVGTDVYNDTSTTSGSTYTYRVSSEDNALNVSKPSSPATVSVPNVVKPDTEPPNVPNVIATVLSPSQVTVAWSAVSDNPVAGASGTAGYIVFKNGNQIASVPANTTSINDGPTSFIAGQTYSYTVLAYDSVGNKSAQSSPSSVIPVPAQAPVASVCNNSPTGNKIDSVVVIAEENRTWDGESSPGVDLGFNSTTMPYLHSLATNCTYFKNDSAVNPSDSSAQQYVGAWTGYSSTQTNVSNDCVPSVSCSYTGNNIFRVFRNSSIPHAEYVEGATTTCSAAGNSPQHVPELYMSDSTDQSNCAAEVLPLTQFSFTSPPAGFSFITPTSCNDGLDCSDNNVDSWLSNSSRLPALFNSSEYKSGKVLVEIWYDENQPRPNLFACNSCHNTVSSLDPTYAGETQLWLNILGASTQNLGGIGNSIDIRPILGTP